MAYQNWPTLGPVSCAQLCLTLCDPMEFSKQESCSGLTFPCPGDLPDPRTQPSSRALAGRFFTTGHPESPYTLSEKALCISFSVSHSLWAVPGRHWLLVGQLFAARQNSQELTVEDYLTDISSRSWHNKTFLERGYLSVPSPCSTPKCMWLRWILPNCHTNLYSHPAIYESVCLLILPNSEFYQTSESLSIWLGEMWCLACLLAKSLQLCPTLCNPVNCSPQGSSVHGILQARILEWVALL